MEGVYLAPAKLNLAIDIKKSDAATFDWDMIATSLNLFDYVHIQPRTDQQIILKTSKSFLPEDHRNLAFRAALNLQKRYSVSQGAEIFIDKNIPISAGLGGGSSDAAAVLRGLNQAWQLNLDLKALVSLAVTLDEDVPFCLYARLARVSGIGDKITPIKTQLNFYFVVVKPNFSVSTKQVLTKIQLDKINKPPQVDTLMHALQNNDYPHVLSSMGNVIEPVTAQDHHQITYLKTKLLDFGADAVMMSGSGPCVFGVCQSYSRARRIQNSMRGFCQQVYLCLPYTLTFSK